MKINLIILILLKCSVFVFSQKIFLEEHPLYNKHSTIDTSEFYSKELTILHTLVRSDKIDRKFLNKEDSVFNNTNKISTLFITNRSLITIEIPTIPIDHIVIDDTKELIIGLSRAEVSPYNIVIYNFRGELLFKKKILPLELVLDSTNYKKFQRLFPEFFKYATINKQILKIDSLYHVDLGYWHKLPEDKKDSIRSWGWMRISHIFSDLSTDSFDGTPSYKLTKYTNFYSQTDPFYDFEIRDSKIIGIILNDEFGGKVKIPIYIDKN